MPYIVKANHYKNKEQLFEGPLDLLLDLIEKEKLDITDIALAQVAEQFISYLDNSKEEITPEHLSSFLLVAGKLILIKSKAIIPTLELEEEEEEDIEELKARLKEYQKFKEISKEIKILENRKERFFSKQRYSGMKVVFCPPPDIASLDLQKAMENVLNKIPKSEHLVERTIDDVISVKDKIEHLKEIISKKIELTFEEIVFSSENKVEIIVTFLAMLELVRRSVIVIEQVDVFGEIKIKNKSL